MFDDLNVEFGISHRIGLSRQDGQGRIDLSRKNGQGRIDLWSFGLGIPRRCWGWLEIP